ncbi:MAG: AI-2E family transporter [Pseudomonadota bacterium]
MEKKTLNERVLLLCVLAISALFLAMIRQFLMAIVLAGIFSALSHPAYRRFLKWFGGRRAAAAIITVLLIICVVMVPLAGLLGVVAAQAVKVGTAATPWVMERLGKPDTLSQSIQLLPFYKEIAPYQSEIAQKIGSMVGAVSGFIVDRLSALTLGTVNVVFSLLVMLYCMLFFLMDGDKMLEKALFYLPLEDKDERRMLDRFTSVTRATLKGTLVIGLLQGALAGGAFYFAGIPSAVFWGAVMAVLSIIPGIGSAIVWAPAAIILAASGHMVAGIGLAVFCAVVVGGADNLLRPMLVGKDTQMPELMIFFGTLGGIMMFGIPGMIVGPIVAALFLTTWDIYGIVFKDVLPPVSSPQAPSGADTDDGGGPDTVALSASASTGKKKES